MMMKLSPEGLEFIEREEGLRLTAYRDMVGVFTIGYGHTGPGVREGLVITQAQAEELFAQDVLRFETVVDRCILGPALRQHEFDAFVSLAYNIGARAFADSTLVRRYNEGDRRAAACQFVRWNKAGGVLNDGLLARRARELTVFLIGYGA